MPSDPGREQLTESILNQGQYKAKRYAVKYDPPCIFLEYEDEDLNPRVRVVKLNCIDANTDVDRLTRKVTRSFPRRLDPATVKQDQVRSLVVKLVDRARQQQLQHKQDEHRKSSSGGGTSTPTRRSGLAPRSDSGLIWSSGSNSAAAASTPAKAGESKRISNGGSAPDDDGSSPGSAGAGPCAAGTAPAVQEDLDAMLDELDREMCGSGPNSNGASNALPWGGAAAAGPTQQMKLISSVESMDGLMGRALGGGNHTGANGHHQPTRFARGAEAEAQSDRLVLDMELSGDLDLNRVTEIELKLAKMKMEQDFLKHQVKPGDPDYEYDKQVEFEATEANEWDTSSIEEEEEDC